MNGQKQGGNVAAYFCLPDGRVLNAVAGPVDAGTLLREARWAVETRKLALVEAANDGARYQDVFRQAHADRLGPQDAKADRRRGQTLDRQGRVHQLLAAQPVPKLQAVYRTVFEDILGEKVSVLPVADGG